VAVNEVMPYNTFIWVSVSWLLLS